MQDRCPRRFLHKTGIETATLDHEIADDSMKNGAVVMTAMDVLKKIVHGFGCGNRIEFNGEIAQVGVELHLRPGGCGFVIGRGNNGW